MGSDERTGMATGQGARSTEQWQRYLAGYSAEVLRTTSDDELAHVSAEQRAAGWLGFAGASSEDLALLEQRLGTALPPSYRSFLAVSDGWLHIGPFMWSMRTTGDVMWLRDADPDLCDILRKGATPAESSLADHALLVSGDGDAQYWLLDPGDVSASGEWAAYIWASWYPGLDDRYESFAALVDGERASFEELNGRDGRPVHPEGVDALLNEGRERALRGDADGAAETLARAAVKGSGAAAYLGVILKAFLEPALVHHDIRNDVLARSHVIEEVGRDQLRAEVVPLFLRNASIGPYRELFTGILTDEEIAAITTGHSQSQAGAEADALDVTRQFLPPQLPEPPEFQAALERARRLLRDGSADAAWAALEVALPSWHSDSPHRIAPVSLLTDPELRRLVTVDRARAIVTTPRGKRAS